MGNKGNYKLETELMEINPDWCYDQLFESCFKDAMILAILPDWLKDESKAIEKVTRGLDSDLPKYRVTFFYSATGNYSKEDYGLFAANSESEAIEKCVLYDLPVDQFYGPNNDWSTRDFFRGCLSAKLEE